MAQQDRCAELPQDKTGARSCRKRASNKTGSRTKTVKTGGLSFFALPPKRFGFDFTTQAFWFCTITQKPKLLDALDPMLGVSTSYPEVGECLHNPTPRLGHVYGICTPFPEFWKS